MASPVLAAPPMLLPAAMRGPANPGLGKPWLRVALVFLHLQSPPLSDGFAHGQDLQETFLDPSAPPLSRQLQALTPTQTMQGPCCCGQVGNDCSITIDWIKLETLTGIVSGSTAGYPPFNRFPLRASEKTSLNSGPEAFYQIDVPADAVSLKIKSLSPNFDATLHLFYGCPIRGDLPFTSTLVMFNDDGAGDLQPLINLPYPRQGSYFFMMDSFGGGEGRYGPFDLFWEVQLPASGVQASSPSPMPTPVLDPPVGCASPVPAAVVSTPILTLTPSRTPLPVPPECCCGVFGMSCEYTSKITLLQERSGVVTGDTSLFSGGGDTVRGVRQDWFPVYPNSGYKGWFLGPEDWYAVDVPINAISLSISICTELSFEPVLGVFKGTCPNGPLLQDSWILQADMNNCGSTWNGFRGVQMVIYQSQLPLGERIWIVVDGYGGLSGHYRMKWNMETLSEGTSITPTPTGDPGNSEASTPTATASSGRMCPKVYIVSATPSVSFSQSATSSSSATISWSSTATGSDTSSETASSTSTSSFSASSSPSVTPTSTVSPSVTATPPSPTALTVSVDIPLEEAEQLFPLSSTSGTSSSTGSPASSASASSFPLRLSCAVAPASLQLFTAWSVPSLLVDTAVTTPALQCSLLREVRGLLLQAGRGVSSSSSTGSSSSSSSMVGMDPSVQWRIEAFSAMRSNSSYLAFAVNGTARQLEAGTAFQKCVDTGIMPDPTEQMFNPAASLYLVNSSYVRTVSSLLEPLLRSAAAVQPASILGRMPGAGPSPSPSPPIRVGLHSCSPILLQAVLDALAAGVGQSTHIVLSATFTITQDACAGAAAAAANAVGTAASGGSSGSSSDSGMIVGGQLSLSLPVPEELQAAGRAVFDSSHLSLMMEQLQQQQGVNGSSFSSSSGNGSTAVLRRLSSSASSSPSSLLYSALSLTALIPLASITAAGAAVGPNNDTIIRASSLAQAAEYWGPLVSLPSSPFPAPPASPAPSDVTQLDGLAAVFASVQSPASLSLIAVGGLLLILAVAVAVGGSKAVKQARAAAEERRKERAAKKAAQLKEIERRLQQAVKEAAAKRKAEEKARLQAAEEAAAKAAAEQAAAAAGESGAELSAEEQAALAARILQEQKEAEEAQAAALKQTYMPPMAASVPSLFATNAGGGGPGAAQNEDSSSSDEEEGKRSKSLPAASSKHAAAHKKQLQQQQQASSSPDGPVPTERQLKKATRSPAAAANAVLLNVLQAEAHKSINSSSSSGGAGGKQAGDVEADDLASDSAWKAWLAYFRQLFSSFSSSSSSKGRKGTALGSSGRKEPSSSSSASSSNKQAEPALLTNPEAALPVVEAMVEAGAASLQLRLAEMMAGMTIGQLDTQPIEVVEADIAVTVEVAGEGESASSSSGSGPEGAEKGGEAFSSSDGRPSSSRTLLAGATVALKAQRVQLQAQSSSISSVKMGSKATALRGLAKPAGAEQKASLFRQKDNKGTVQDLDLGSGAGAAAETSANSSSSSGDGDGTAPPPASSDSAAAARAALQLLSSGAIEKHVLVSVVMAVTQETAKRLVVLENERTAMEKQQQQEQQHDRVPGGEGAINGGGGGGDSSHVSNPLHSRKKANSLQLAAGGGTAKAQFTPQQSRDGMSMITTGGRIYAATTATTTFSSTSAPSSAAAGSGKHMGSRHPNEDVQGEQGPSSVQQGGEVLAALAHGEMQGEEVEGEAVTASSSSSLSSTQASGSQSMSLHKTSAGQGGRISKVQPPGGTAQPVRIQTQQQQGQRQVQQLGFHSQKEQLEAITSARAAALQALQVLGVNVQEGGFSKAQLERAASGKKQQKGGAATATGAAAAGAGATSASPGKAGSSKGSSSNSSSSQQHQQQHEQQGIELKRMSASDHATAEEAEATGRRAVLYLLQPELLEAVMQTAVTAANASAAAVAGTAGSFGSAIGEQSQQQQQQAQGSVSSSAASGLAGNLAGYRHSGARAGKVVFKPVTSPAAGKAAAAAARPTPVVVSKTVVVETAAQRARRGSITFQSKAGPVLQSSLRNITVEKEKDREELFLGKPMLAPMKASSRVGGRAGSAAGQGNSTLNKSNNSSSSSSSSNSPLSNPLRMPTTISSPFKDSEAKSAASAAAAAARQEGGWVSQHSPLSSLFALGAPATASSFSSSSFSSSGAAGGEDASEFQTQSPLSSASTAGGRDGDGGAGSESDGTSSGTPNGGRRKSLFATLFSSPAKNAGFSFFSSTSSSSSSSSSAASATAATKRVHLKGPEAAAAAREAAELAGSPQLRGGIGLAGGPGLPAGNGSTAADGCSLDSEGFELAPLAHYSRSQQQHQQQQRRQSLTAFDSFSKPPAKLSHSGRGSSSRGITLHASVPKAAASTTAAAATTAAASTTAVASPTAATAAAAATGTMAGVEDDAGGVSASSSSSSSSGAGAASSFGSSASAPLFEASKEAFGGELT